MPEASPDTYSPIHITTSIKPSLAFSLAFHIGAGLTLGFFSGVGIADIVNKLVHFIGVL